MELIYHSGIKSDLNLSEVEEILLFIFTEFKFEEYDASLKVAEIIDKFLNISMDRFGEVFVYVSIHHLKVKILKSLKEEVFFFSHKRKLSKFFLLYLKDSIKIKNRFTLLVDTLTSLPNRRYFFRELENTIETYKELNKEFAVIFLDVKGFKFINDYYGQEVGDIVLQEVANRIKKIINSQSFLARIGADEFVIILKDIKNKKEIEEFVKFMIKVVQEPIYIEEHYIDISIIIGVAVFPYDGKNKDEILQAADLALQEVKHSESNIDYLFFKKEFKLNFLENRRLEEDLAKAIEKEEFFLLYQPKVDINNWKIVGVEALIRWKHSIYGIIPNGKWVPIMENSKYLKEIGKWVLKKATFDISSLNNTIGVKIGVSVNVDIREIISDYYIDELNSLDISKREILTLELLERKLVKYWDELVRIVAILHSLNIKLSFDDFGTGNTTLKYLTKVLPDELKIDKSFVTNIHISKTKMVTKAIIAMAKSLNIKVIAEGVEKREELDVLKELGCDIIQGYYFAKPMRFEELKEFIIDFERKKNDFSNTRTG